MELLNNYTWAKIICSGIAFLIAIIGHEIMHGLVAKHYGDDTASLSGRLSINPLKHIDTIGSIIIPALLFVLNAPFLIGWAKPVPIDITKIINNHGYLAACNVSLAGIIYNLSLAILAILILDTINTQITLSLALFIYFLIQLVLYNLILGIFNLYPIPPLDGSKAFAFLCLKFGFFNIAKKIFEFERYGIFILLILIATPLSMIFFYPLNFLIKFLIS